MPVDAVMTDNWANFCSEFFAKLLARCRIAHLRTRAYRPQTKAIFDGQRSSNLELWFCYLFSKSDKPLWDSGS